MTEYMRRTSSSEYKRKHPVLQAAKDYISLGLKVVPLWGTSGSQCDCGNENCSNAGKHPIGSLVPHGGKDASDDIKTVSKWFKKYPNANIGIILDGLVVIDVDGDVGKKSLKKLGELPKTAFVRTGRGFHYYFKGKAKNTTNWKPGIDCKSAGYIIVPPSRHVSGRAYRWVNELKQVAPLPTSLVDTKRKITAVDFESNTIVEGQRNKRLTSLAGSLRRQGFNEEVIAEALHAVNELACEPALGENEINRIAKSINSYDTPNSELFGEMKDVVVTDVKWLYPFYIPLGCLTAFDGDPGIGKSTFTILLASRISTGKPMPNADVSVNGNVLIVNAEDDASRVLRPRLEANGADVSKIRYSKKHFFLTEEGLDNLELEIAEFKPKLVIVDPLFVHLSPDVDTHKMAEVMQALSELDELARRYDTSILLVRHLTKSQEGDAIRQGQGSMGIVGRVRSQLILVRHPKNKNQRYLVHSKSNYGAECSTLIFEMRVEDDAGQPRLDFFETSELTANEVISSLKGSPGAPPTKRNKAQSFILENLSSGWAYVTKLNRKGKEVGLNPKTIQRASEELHLRKSGNGKSAIWAFPGCGPDAKNVSKSKAQKS